MEVKMDKDLRQRITETNYRGLTGEAAVTAAYDMVGRKYDRPKGEKDVAMTVMNPQGFRNLFDMYFTINHGEAIQIVWEHNQRTH